MKFIGYETYVKQVSLGVDETTRLVVSIKPNTKDLGSVVIVAKKDAQWRKYLKEFEEIFLGQSINASNCKILNKDALDFIYDEEKEQLTAFSDEPLIIENKQLGYRVGYYLEQFVMDYSTNLSGYFGYTIFKSIKPKNERRARTIERNRKSTYEGSTAHFFKSLYADRLKEEGFVVRLSRERLDKRIVAYDEKNVFGTLKTGQARDYKGLSFENYLTVLYLREEEPVEYTATLESQLGSGLIIPRPSDNKPFQESRVLILEGSSAIDFESNGYIRNPMSFYSLGYWAFEKVADMVPLDYNPEVNN